MIVALPMALTLTLIQRCMLFLNLCETNVNEVFHDPFSTMWTLIFKFEKLQSFDNDWPHSEKRIRHTKPNHCIYPSTRCTFCCKSRFSHSLSEEEEKKPMFHPYSFIRFYWGWVSVIVVHLISSHCRFSEKHCPKEKKTHKFPFVQSLSEWFSSSRAVEAHAVSEWEWMWRLAKWSGLHLTSWCLSGSIIPYCCSHEALLPPLKVTSRRERCHS